MSFRDLGLAGTYSATEDRVNEFYVPLLKQAVAYDRVTGYFRSSSLSLAAAGLSRFISNGGLMRMIAGVEFNEDDIKAILDGAPLDDVLATRLLASPLEATDIVTEHRLETLAWLVREGRLQIKVGVPVDIHGRPLRRDQTNRYFHSKYGILRDLEGNQIAFMGSNNETASGLAKNDETFSVFPSWMQQVWEWNGRPIVDRFEKHWQDQPDKGWKILPLPEAVREKLVEWVKDKGAPPPEIDPEETAVESDADEDAQRLAFVVAAPSIEGGTGVGFATAGVEAWPHQLAIARRAVDTFPRSYLLADEVGLGKTIEAGLILRELLISGRVQTALLLVPASVLRQWQEELDEKFGLRIPRLEGNRFLTRDDIEIPWSQVSPWNAFPVVLASSHLARRRARRLEVLAAGPWDIVLVDEAHHARRQGSKADDTPNSLLALLLEMRARGLWKALYLASATPMQMHAHEAWDLLHLLGLTKRWGSSAATFERYYRQLREDFPAREWEFLKAMQEDFFSDPAVNSDPVLSEAVKTSLGLAKSRVIRKFSQQGLTTASAEHLPSDSRHWFDEWLRQHTPTRERVFRTTRAVLRQYKAEGILPKGATIPVRHVYDRFIPFTAAEEKLYQRIETYIARFYDAYMNGPKAQKPLGFIMTVYRRRLTSSFLAIERSLRRRRDVLLGNASAEALLDPDDLAAIESSALIDMDDLSKTGKAVATEANELGDFLEELAQRPPDESKMEYLHNELDDAFKQGHETAIVFTQYTDTMDYLRNQLTPWYGAKVICYSGRGGERWNPATREWIPLTKAQVKNLFREGKEVKILLGTDSLSEGLNLQTCGKLINYDMPWNFMRVEQRIGRIDRINGRPQVEISNYFYKGTIEEQVYSGIRRDYDWFTDIVGPAQPVLGKVESILEGLTMASPGADRQGLVQDKIEEIRQAIEQAQAQAVTLADVGSAATLTSGKQPAIDLPGLERVLLRVEATKSKLRPHETESGVYLLQTSLNPPPVTFRRSVLERLSPAVRLLTYGTEEFRQLLGDGDDSVRNGQFTIDGTPVRSVDQLEAVLSQRGR
jgi:hypothetical protein